MAQVNELRKKKAELIKELRQIVNKAEADNKRQLNEDEDSRFQLIDKEIRDIDKSIEREDRLALLEKDIDTPERTFRHSKEDDNNDGEDRNKSKSEWINLAEFFNVVNQKRQGIFDPRLTNRYRKFDSKDARSSMQMGTGVLGGFALPEQFIPSLLSVTPQDAIIRPRATVIPAGNPPDVKVTIPALDQTSNENMYGGIVIYHKGELQTMTETDMRLKEVTLEPKMKAGFMRVSNQLLDNWEAASALIQQQLRLAMMGSDDSDFLTGNGVNKATGIMNANCAINYSRATANQIAYADIVGMYARMRLVGANNLIWIASQTTIPQLANIADSGSNNLWVQNAALNLPPSLMGFPVYFHERCPALGSTGDLMLVNPTYYLIKDGSGPYVDISDQVYFTTYESAFRIVWHNDGNAWLTEAIPLEGSTSNTVSPIVVLN